MKKVFIVCSLFLISIFSYGQAEIYKKVKIHLQTNTLQQIGQMGIAIEGKVEKGKFLTGEFSETELQKISNAGIYFDILVDDVKKMYVERNKLQQAKTSEFAGKYITPSHFRLGSLGGYLNLNELLAELDSMHLFYPNLITARQTIDSIETYEGRNIYFVKISDNPDVDENEPEVMYSALTHAREPMGMQQLIYYMWYLLENYENDPEIQYLVDNCQLYFAPCVNPDGYRYNQQTDPNGGGMWRKNRRKVNNTEYGIDLNRNYGYQWGYDNIGSSPSPSSDTYRGTAAFSEPETMAMKWFTENHNIQLMLDYHTYSDVLLYPWGYIDQVCDDSLLYTTYSSILTRENGFAYGTAVQAIGYAANGGSFDWFYGEQETKNKIIAWGPEVGDPNDGFWPAMDRIETIAQIYMDQNLWLAKLALDYAVVHDNGENYIGEKSGFLKFELQKIGMQESAGYTLSLTGISPNITSTGEPVRIENIGLLGFKTDSIAYSLVNQMDFGDTIQFLLSIDNGKFVQYDTITKIFGTPVYVMRDSCNNLENWSGHSWGISNTEYHSAFSSVCDSPEGDYTSNANKDIILGQEVEIPVGIMAELSYYAKWDLENEYDYVQFFVSSNQGASWNWLQGSHMNTGSTHQPQGQPLYDGTQNTWVKESFDLTSYMGQSLKFKFILVSDGSVEGDGFYFDDFTIKTLEYNPYNQIETSSAVNFSLSPNPVSDFLNVRLQNGSENNTVEIINNLGQKCSTFFLLDQEGQIPVSNLTKGIYFLKLRLKDGIITRKFIKK